MPAAKYDKSSVKAIALHGKLLIGKSLSEVVELPNDILNLADKRNKGNLGKLVEKFHFEHEPPNDDAPDFVEAGLELKVTGVVRNGRRKDDESFKAKERLVLKNIHFGKIQQEVWEKSSIKSKCQKMLLLFYLYEKETPAIHRAFVLEPMVSAFPGTNLDKNDLESSGIYFIEIPEEDVAQMKRDWEVIREKVMNNEAHTISEGDTKYLKACRKGAGGENERLQRYTSIRKPDGEREAPTRAFSLPASYVTTLIEAQDGKINKMGVTKEISFEEVTQLRIAPYIGKTTQQISTKLGVPFTTKDKGFRARLIKSMLSRGGSSVHELDKAGITVKTIVVDNRLLPKESMSFPAFDYCEIVNQEFEDSEFFDSVESTFLFVVFRRLSNGDQVLEKAFYWNMPYADRLEASKVWSNTRNLVASGSYQNLPRSTQNRVAHVRQHARRKSDVSPTPQGGFEVKRCFWLNRTYIGAVVKDAYERSEHK